VFINRHRQLLIFYRFQFTLVDQFSGYLPVIAPSGQPLIIDPTNDLNQNYRDIELQQLFTKLEKDEQILKVLQIPSYTKTIEIVEDLDPYDPPYQKNDGCWHIELLPKFNEYYVKIQNEPEYQEFTGKKPKKEVEKENKPKFSTAKYDRKALEKIWNILQEIEEKKQLGIEDSQIRIPFYIFTKNTQEDDRVFEERKTVLEKLKSLEALTNLHKVDAGDYFWAFSLTDKYNSIFNDFESQYKKVAEDYQEKHQKELAKVDDIIYEVKYSETREIFINNFLLAKPDFNRENEIVFSYVYSRPNQRISKLKIEKESKTRLLKNLPKIVENLGFTGDRKIFFDVSSEGILFRNPITKQKLEELGKKFLKLK